MKKKLSFKPAFSATVISLFIFLILIAVVTFCVYLLVKEAAGLIDSYGKYISDYFDDFDVLSTLDSFTRSNGIFDAVSSVAMGVAKAVPIAITLIIVSFASTVYLMNNLSKIRNYSLKNLSDTTNRKVSRTMSNGSVFLRKFVRSYLILYFITFAESVFIFILTGVKYPLVFAFLAAVADILPILGPSAVYIPLAVYFFFCGNYLTCVFLLVFWLIIVIIRQITEPKIVSDTIKIHPLAILAALYFSIVSASIWVLFYLIILFVVYKILLESDILSPLFLSKEGK